MGGAQSGNDIGLETVELVHTEFGHVLCIKECQMPCVECVELGCGQALHLFDRQQSTFVAIHQQAISKLAAVKRANLSTGEHQQIAGFNGRNLCTAHGGNLRCRKQLHIRGGQISYLCGRQILNLTGGDGVDQRHRVPYTLAPWGQRRAQRCSE